MYVIILELWYILAKSRNNKKKAARSNAAGKADGSKPPSAATMSTEGAPVNVMEETNEELLEATTSNPGGLKINAIGIKTIVTNVLVIAINEM